MQIGCVSKSRIGVACPSLRQQDFYVVMAYVFLAYVVMAYIDINI